MTLYKDIAKFASSIVGDDFDTKMTVKAKSKCCSTVGVTSKSVIGKDLAVTGALEAKYAVKGTNFSVDKLSLDSKGKLSCETSLSDVAPGLDIGLTRVQGSSPSTEVSLEFKQKQFHADSSVVYNKGSNALNVSSSLLGKTHGVSVGGKGDFSFDYKETKTTAGDWGFGASYVGGKFGVVATTNNLTSHSVYGMYTCTDKFKAAMELACTPGEDSASTKWSSALAGAYVCAPNNTFKGKVTKTNDSLSFDIGHKSKVAKGTELAAAVGYKVGESKPHYGFTLTIA